MGEGGLICLEYSSGTRRGAIQSGAFFRFRSAAPQSKNGTRRTADLKRHETCRNPKNSKAVRGRPALQNLSKRQYIAALQK